jgi:hypothetical protein
MLSSSISVSSSPPTLSDVEQLFQNSLVCSTQLGGFGWIAIGLFKQAHLHGHFNDRHCGPIVSLQRALQLTEHDPFDLAYPPVTRSLLNGNLRRHRQPDQRS